MQIVRGGKLSRLHALVIRGKTFAIVWPVQFAGKSGTCNNSKFTVSRAETQCDTHVITLAAIVK